MPAFEVKGKVFFITGAAEGLGRGLAEGALSKQGKVFFIDVNEGLGKSTLAELAEVHGPENVGFAVCDVTNRQRFEETFQEAVDRFGHVDVMVNNAGILGENRPQVLISINLLGPINGTEIAQGHMRKDKGGKGGRIINMSSVAGFYNVFNLPAYCATKQGIRSYTKSLSLVQDKVISDFQALCQSKAPVTGLESATGKPLADLMAHSLSTVPPTLEQVVDGFFKLLTLERMNGAHLMVTKEITTFGEVDFHPTGDSYPPLAK
ncbi:15-hydroxyprostaglandin dehydrogenase [NAD(+)] [Plakobranchus ocellatus]|uniref:15-hydroxyprostaglandin dehydrogenase [NAD(+)] n=1 Tax=Plakobranchus ocellatus TaxID=259542 RepID=A0AAV4BVZ2_9GAST|nr:15-hydroxyprostaglandin dehydrogenase [NAD(+)] [Plakobranchus ocellatus]